jgi:hypothetical protein
VQPDAICVSSSNMAGRIYSHGGRGSSSSLFSVSAGLDRGRLTRSVIRSARCHAAFRGTTMVAPPGPRVHLPASQALRRQLARPGWQLLHDAVEHVPVAGAAAGHAPRGDAAHALVAHLLALAPTRSPRVPEESQAPPLRRAQHAVMTASCSVGTPRDRSGIPYRSVGKLRLLIFARRRGSNQGGTASGCSPAPAMPGA